MTLLPIKALEKTFNAYINLDLESKALLTPLMGRALGLHIQRPKISIYFSFYDQGVMLSVDAPQHINTEIYASLFQLIRLKFNKNSAVVNTQFYIKGDVDTAQLFHELIKKHHIDWEEHLSTIIGDVSAHKMMRLLKKPADFLKRNKEKLSQDISEYCQEESRVLPHRHEVSVFRQEVDELRLQLDRLEARIHLLKKQHD